MKPIRFFNTLSRQIEVFTPLKKSGVRIYTCGPTVYNYAHLGNLRTYIFEDILERTLVWFGYPVKRVMNITDVGHLTGDGDTGEDKIEKEARASQKTVKDIARTYTKAFVADLKELNIKVPKILAPATQFVPQQIALVKQLAKKGYAYETREAVYFDVAKFPAYGKLSGQAIEDKLTAARKEVVADPEKRHPADFALWFKRVGKFEHHILYWPSPWGDGFPGWHVECSAISRHFLGQPFDIHAGGVDHIGTHHTNELAQSQAAYGTPLARFWLHGEFLLSESSKMAKSERNFFTVGDLKAKKIDPLAFRYLTLTAHYRSPLHFSWLALDQAKSALSNLAQNVLRVSHLASGATKGSVSAPELEPMVHAFTEALAQDLNVPKALGVLHGLLAHRTLATRHPRAALATIFNFDRVLGLNLKEYTSRYTAAFLIKKDKVLRQLVAEREEFRVRQQFIQADRLRKKIVGLGYLIEDTAAGPFVAPKSPTLLDP